jgi:hypothetical protein
MKSFLFSSIILTLNICFINAQTNLFPSTGNVGIGTTSPLQELHILASIDAADLIIERSSGKWGRLIAGTLGAGFYFKSDGRFTFSPAADLSITSSIPSSSLYIYGSDHPLYPGQMIFGSETPGDNSKLSINGRVRSEELKIVADITAPDYVFKEDYNLRSLEDVKNYIKENGHLPEIPSAQEFKENGILIGQMSFDLLKKIEELTLYVLQLKEENSKLLQRIELLERKQ